MDALIQSPEQRTAISGIGGYQRVAALFYAGSMQKAYLEMRQACNRQEMNFDSLMWGAEYIGSGISFRRLSAVIRRAVSGADPKLTGFQGYLEFADRFTEGNMQKAFIIGSAICKAHNLSFQSLEWGAALNAYTSVYREVEAQLRSAAPEGRLSDLPCYGRKGQLRLTKKHYPGSPAQAERLMRFVCRRVAVPFEQMRWKRIEADVA